jgi:uncharacterized membrane protein
MSDHESPPTDKADNLKSPRPPADAQESRANTLAKEDGERYHGLVAASWQGPLPPPNHLEHYKEIQADFPERILKLTEDEAAHRRDYNLRVLAATKLETLLGQIFGLVVALVAFAVAAYLAHLGHPGASAGFGATTVAGLVWVFVKGRSSESGNRSLSSCDPDQGPDDS